MTQWIKALVSKPNEFDRETRCLCDSVTTHALAVAFGRLCTCRTSIMVTGEMA